MAMIGTVSQREEGAAYKVSEGRRTSSLVWRTEPPETVLDRASKISQNIILPQIGQVVVLKQKKYEIKKWWEEFN